MRKPVLILTLLFLTACGLFGSGDNDEGPPRTIIFSAQDDDGIFQIYKMREDGSGVKRLTGGDYASIQPAWSPDGDRIAYARSFGSTGGEELWVMAADGSDKQPLITNPQTGSPQRGNHPAWSPNGNKLAFDRCLNCELGGLNYDVFVADLHSGTIDTLTTHSVEDSHPTWRPDGKQIAFTSDRDYYDADTLRFRKDLYAINVSSKNARRLTKTGNATRPAWSPDGSKIVYEWNVQGNDVFLYNHSSGQIKNLETGLEFAGGGMWNTKGTKLLVTGRIKEGERPEMRLLNIEREHPEILKTVTLNENAIGRDFDWYDTQ